MSYAGTRDSEQLRILDTAIAQFIQRYTSNPSTTQRRTLFLFPGGMGCQLFRARTAYQDAVATPQTFQHDKVWLTLGRLLGNALTLPMHKDNQGVYRDLDDRIIIADGAVVYLRLGLAPSPRRDSSSPPALCPRSGRVRGSGRRAHAIASANL